MAMRTRDKRVKSTKRKPARKNGNGHVKTVLDVPVEFGGVSIGDGTARVGIRIDRGALNLLAADEVFCGHRLTGQLQLGSNGDSPGQGKLFDCEISVDGTFDVKRLGANAKSITTGLTFSLADVDIESLARFSKGSGRLLVETVAELPDDVDDDEDEDPAAGFLPGTLKAEGKWREFQLDAMFSGAMLKSLKKAGIATMGDMADYTASGKLLIDIDGIGEGKAAKIEEAMLEFWKQNPDADKA